MLEWKKLASENSGDTMYVAAEIPGGVLVDGVVFGAIQVRDLNYGSRFGYKNHGSPHFLPGYHLEEAKVSYTYFGDKLHKLVKD